MNTNLANYHQSYSEENFWRKVKQVAGKLGRDVLYNALVLWFIMADENVPAKAKAIVIGALGFFISPIDVVPDMIPFLGYCDDAAVLIWAVVTIATFADISRARQRAEQKLNDIIG